MASISQVPTRPRSLTRAIAFAFAVLFAAAHIAAAQALPTASKSMDISAFGGYQFAQPDFGDDNNTGGTIGINVTRYFHLPVAPSLEVRANYSTGDVITEKSVVGGIRAQGDFRRRYHPYGDFLFGEGTIRYTHTLPYPPDRGTVLSYGIGVDIDLIRHFQAKVDIQSQHYNLGENTVLRPQGGDYTLSPTTFVIGLAYRIPFRPHIKQD